MAGRVLLRAVFLIQLLPESMRGRFFDARDAKCTIDAKSSLRGCSATLSSSQLFYVPVAAMVNRRINKDLKERAGPLSAIGYDTP